VLPCQKWDPSSKAHILPEPTVQERVCCRVSDFEDDLCSTPFGVGDNYTTTCWAPIIGLSFFPTTLPCADSMAEMHNLDATYTQQVRCGEVTDFIHSTNRFSMRPHNLIAKDEMLRDHRLHLFTRPLLFAFARPSHCRCHDIRESSLTSLSGQFHTVTWCFFFHSTITMPQSPFVDAHVGSSCELLHTYPTATVRMLHQQYPCPGVISSKNASSGSATFCKTSDSAEYQMGCCEVGASGVHAVPEHFMSVHIMSCVVHAKWI
jgi:hypothetical protein